MPNVFHIVINPKALEYYADIKDYVKNLKYFQYLYVVEHIGQNEKHYHMLLQLSRSMPKLSVKKLHGAHIQPKEFGSTQSMKDYLDCKDDKHKKEGVTAVLIDEEGEFKKQGGNYTVEYLRDLDNPSELPAIFYNTYNKIQNQKKNRLSLGNWRKHIEVYYIQGPSAIGKSEKAEELIQTWYLDKGIEDPNEMFFDELKFTDGFYQGVNTDYPSKVAVFDDFRVGNMKPEEFINLIDYRVHNMNIKGSSVKNNYELIIFTSVQKLSSIYRNVDDYERREQWERRIKVINMYPPERVNIGGLPVGYRTEFNQLEEYEVTNDWDNSRVIIH